MSEVPTDDGLALGFPGAPEIDDEADERHEHEMDRILRQFEDEPYVQHDVIPESDSDDDDDGGERQRTHIRRGQGRLYFHQTFINGVAFKENVLDHALRDGRNVYQYRFDKLKIGFKCLGGDPQEEECKWQAYASILPKDRTWKIRKFVGNHSCTPNGECTMLRSPVIARLFVDKIRDDPEYFKPMKIADIIREKWGLTATRDQIQFGRCKALKWIESEYDNQFICLRDYAAELESSNENSSVEIETVLDEEGKDVFNRFYVCFDILRRTWKETCRQIIGVDGTFLKGKIKGQLLVALGRDANNAIYPIAWGVVQVENKDNWVWFVNKLKVDLDLNDGDGYIMVSDRQKVLVLV